MSRTPIPETSRPGRSRQLGGANLWGAHGSPMRSEVVECGVLLNLGALQFRYPNGPRTPINGSGDIKPCYLGPWTLRGI